ncbi:MAG: dihydroorotase [Clostridiaceae bacterium]|nr:dihydroorotase [Clostridiaceae bacterium]
MRIAIINGRVLDPSQAAGEPVAKPVFIEDGRLVAKLSGDADRTVDADGLFVFPGLIDAHCHLRDPGYEYKEDIASGTASAARGGFTTVACMPNTLPVCDHAALVHYIRDKAVRQGKARVLPIGAVSKGQQGQELAEIGLMAEAGIVAISDDGHPVETADLMRKAMLYASPFNLTVISHCEDMSLAGGGHMNEGTWSTRLGLRGIPDIAESIMVGRDCQIAGYTGLPVHIAHVSCRASVRLIREAKARGVPVSAETCPHYFALTEQACDGYNTMAKMNPPLRTPDDVEAIIEGLADGTIDVIATDHAPHHNDEKDLEFALASNGIIGFETAFGLGYTLLVRTGRLSLRQFLAAMTVNPARILRQPLGSLAVGAPADVLVADLETPWTVARSQMRSKSRNTPFEGMTLAGRPVMTICEGRITHDELC